MTTAVIKLGGVDYTVRAFNIGELERVADAFQGPSHRAAFAILRIALERADPRPADPAKVEATTDEVTAAVPILLRLAGLQQPDQSPPPAEAAA